MACKPTCHKTQMTAAAAGRSNDFPRQIIRSQAGAQHCKKLTAPLQKMHHDDGLDILNITKSHLLSSHYRRKRHMLSDQREYHRHGGDLFA
jgi:hypothetical protein